jgi:Kef-type K+ transport system membrane component KefB
VRRYSLHLERLRIANAPFVVAIALMLGLAALAGELRMAAIIGAFLAGMVFAESREQFQLEHRVQPLYDFLVPFFFVITGSHVDLGALGDGDVVLEVLAITALAIATKALGAGAGAYGLNRRGKAIIGAGMVPRGEVGLIVASLGLGLGAISADVFSILVLMSVGTTLVAPAALTLVLRRAEYQPLRDGVP